MTYTVNITSQGQFSIPVKIRKQLGFNNKALVSTQGNKIIIEPIKDLLELKGSLKSTIKPNPKAQREAFENYLAEEGTK